LAASCDHLDTDRHGQVGGPTGADEDKEMFKEEHNAGTSDSAEIRSSGGGGQGGDHTPTRRGRLLAARQNAGVVPPMNRQISTIATAATT